MVRTEVARRWFVAVGNGESREYAIHEVPKGSYLRESVFYFEIYGPDHSFIAKYYGTGRLVSFPMNVNQRLEICPRAIFYSGDTEVLTMEVTAGTRINMTEAGARVQKSPQQLVLVSCDRFRIETILRVKNNN